MGSAFFDMRLRLLSDSHRASDFFDLIVKTFGQSLACS